ncbi:MAG: LamG domain-containing protein [Chitinophagaceae bacterium]
MQNKINNSLTALLAVAVCGLLFSSCQKKFDTSSYAPVQTFGGYGTSADVAKSNLVAYFAFDNSLIDSISKTSLTNAGTSFSTGVKGNSMQVGANHYATFVPTAAIKGLQNISIAYWVNTPINTAGIQTPVSFVNSTQFWGNLDMFFDGQTATSSVFKMHVFGSAGAKEAWLTSWSLTNPWSTWTHIALTYDMASTTFTFYVNGTAVGTSVQSGFGALNFANFPAIVFGTVQFQTTPSMTSGATAQSWASYVLGNIDQVRIYDKALPASDVKALYQLENLGK